jgi:hypothetical protein
MLKDNFKIEKKFSKLESNFNNRDERETRKPKQGGLQIEQAACQEQAFFPVLPGILQQCRTLEVRNILASPPMLYWGFINVRRNVCARWRKVLGLKLN